MEKKKDSDLFLCRPIGIIHTPFKELENMPIQPSAPQGFVALWTFILNLLKD